MRKFVTSFVMILVVFSSFLFAHSNKALAANDKLTELNRKIEEYQKEIDRLKNEANTLTNQVKQFDTQITLTSLEIEKTEEEIALLGGRIDELEEVVKTATVVSGSSKAGNDGIGVGTKVTVKVNGVNNVFDIVGEWEADPVNKKISHESPLGLALIGKKVGEKVEVEAPAGNIRYEILAVE